MRVDELSFVWAKQKSGLKGFYFSQTGSTNYIGKNANLLVEADKITEPKLDSPSIPLFIIAGKQTMGRGRGKNEWLNALNCGDSLLATFVLPMQKAPEIIWSMGIGFILYQALKRAFALEDGILSIKPPNDIYLNEKKIAGLLIEITEGAEEKKLIVGLGLNVWSHPAGILTAGHLYEQCSDKPKDDVFTKIWFSFLDAFFVGLLQLIEEPKGLLMQKTEFLNALNQFPMRGQNYIDFDAHGNLYGEGGRKILWSSL